MISRQNILQALARDKNRYQSCIITSYSFSLPYFEQRVLPILRACGIVNINLLLDARMLEAQLTSGIMGDLWRHDSSYSISTVNSPGAFHPKILLAVGKENGMLAIGSGNLTGAGMNYNEEIWGIFRFQQSNTTTKPLFQHAVSYLQQLESNAIGINKIKLDWIREHSKWYDQLYKLRTEGSETMYGNTRIQLLSSRHRHSIFRQILDILPPNPNKIKVLSPFYNENGGFLLNLFNALRPSRIYCLVEPAFEKIPHEILDHSAFSFSLWKETEEQSNVQSVILHAKAYQFEYARETYFLFGSPNATEEAFGNKSIKGVNEEMCVLLQSSERHDYFGELGIVFPTHGNLRLEDLSFSPNRVDATPSMIQYPLHIQHAESFEDTLRISFKEPENELYGSLILFDAYGEIVYKGEKNLLHSGIACKIPFGAAEKTFKIAFYDDQKQISNCAILHKIESLQLTHPDARLGMLNDILSRPVSVDETFYLLLKHISWNDIISSPEAFNPGYIGRKSPDLQDETSARTIHKLSEEEFNTSTDLSQYGGRSSYDLLSLLERALRHLPAASGKNILDTKESTESIALLDNDEGVEEDASRQIDKKFEITVDEHFELQRILDYAFKKLGSHFSLTPAAFNQLTSPQHSNRQFSLKHEIKLVLIGLHLILAKLDKTFSEYRNVVQLRFNSLKILSELEPEFGLFRLEDQAGNDKETVTYTIDQKQLEPFREKVNRLAGCKILFADLSPSKEIKHTYLPIKGWPEDGAESHMDKFFINGVRTYLLQKLTNATESDHEDTELTGLENNLLERALLIFCAYRWSASQLQYRDLFILNLIHLLQYPLISPNELMDNIRSILQLHTINPADYDQSLSYTQRLYEKYMTWRKTYTNNPESLKHEITKSANNRILFSKRFGFGKLISSTSDKKINLFSPLAIYDARLEDYGFYNIFIGQRATFFT